MILSTANGSMLMVATSGTAEIFMKLLRQSPDFATKQDNCADSCPKRAADNLFFQR